MSDQTQKPFSLSIHAQERLTERSTLTESELLELLQHKKYRRTHTKLTPNIGQKEIDYYIEEYGLTFNEMKRHRMVKLRPAFKHLLVWSCPDQRPLTLIMNSDNGIILTVLHSDDFSINDWSDKITDELVSDARRMAEELHRPAVNTYEMHVNWLEEDGMPKHMTFSKLKIVSADPLSPPLEELERLVRCHVVAGRDIRLFIRNKKNRSDIVLEKLLGSTDSRV